MALAATLPPAATATATPARPSFTVQGQSVNVCTGPGVAYPVIGQARQGQSYEITGKNPAQDWWEFDYPAGQGSQGSQTSLGRKGWVNAGVVVANALAASVKMAQNSSPVPKPAPTPTPQSPTAPTPSASCPAWYQRPEPGKGVLVIENHDTGRLPTIVEEIFRRRDLCVARL